MVPPEEVVWDEHWVDLHVQCGAEIHGQEIELEGRVKDIVLSGDAVQGLVFQGDWLDRVQAREGVMLEGNEMLVVGHGFFGEDHDWRLVYDLVQSLALFNGLALHLFACCSIHEHAIKYHKDPPKLWEKSKDRSIKHERWAEEDQAGCDVHPAHVVAHNRARVDPLRLPVRSQPL